MRSCEETWFRHVSPKRTSIAIALSSWRCPCSACPATQHGGDALPCLDKSHQIATIQVESASIHNSRNSKRAEPRQHLTDPVMFNFIIQLEWKLEIWNWDSNSAVCVSSGEDRRGIWGISMKSSNHFQPKTGRAEGFGQAELPWLRTRSYWYNLFKHVLRVLGTEHGICGVLDDFICVFFKAHVNDTMHVIYIYISI